MKYLLLIVVWLACVGTAQAAISYDTVTYEAACLANQDIVPLVEQHGGNVMRFIINPSDAGQGVTCVREVANAGIHVYLTLQFDNTWTPQQTANWFANTLQDYQPYVWAVGVGNEQELPRTGGEISSDPGPLPPYLGGRQTVCFPHSLTRHRRKHVKRLAWHWRHHHRIPVWRWHHHHRIRVRHWHWVTHRYVYHTQNCRPSNAGEDYTDYWNAVEPVLQQVVPNAIRVFGEMAPWGFQVLQEGYDEGRPVGVQAIAFHCYDTVEGGLQEVPQIAAWAQTQGVPLWCSEMAPSFNPGYATWVQYDTSSEWIAKLDSVEARSPDLQMVSYYDWPGF